MTRLRPRPRDVSAPARPVLGVRAQPSLRGQASFHRLVDGWRRGRIDPLCVGPDGVLATAPSGTTIIDLSSVHPDTSRRLASAARLRNVAVLDASVSGSCATCRIKQCEERVARPGVVLTDRAGTRGRAVRLMLRRPAYPIAIFD
jgi:NAD binding domain of 6-phosphogluconate dehydrogenase